MKRETWIKGEKQMEEKIGISRKRFRFNGAWSALFWSYILILLLLLVFGTVLYWSAKKVVVDSVERSNSAMLGQLREFADGQLQMIEQLEQQIANHPKLLQLMRIRVPLSGVEEYEMVALADDLNRYKQLTPFISDYYIYLPNADTMLGPGVKTTPDILFGSAIRFEGKNAEDWVKEFQSGYHYRSFLPSLQSTNSLGEQKDVLTYMQTLPLGSRSNGSATLFMIINEDELRKMFRGIATAGKGEIYILNSDDQIISATTDAPSPPAFKYTDLPGNQGKMEIKDAGKGMVVSYVTSSVFGWKYVLEVPRAVFLKEVNEVRSWSLLIFILAALSGAAVSVYLSYRNIRPIRNLVSIVNGGGTGDSTHQGPAEYELIRTSIQSARLKESELRSRLSQQAPIIRIHFLNRLIKGYADLHELQPESLAFMEIRFISDLFSVITVDVEDMSAFSAENDPKEWLFINFVISNIAADLANERHIAYTTELDQGRIAVLVNFREEDAETCRAEAITIAEQLEQVLCQRFHLKVAVGTSFVALGIQEIGEAFREALKSMDENVKRQTGASAVDALFDQELSYYYPLDIEQQLTNYVKSGEAEKTEQLLNALYTDHFNGDGSGQLVGSHFLLHLSATLLRIVQNTPKADSVMTKRLLQSQTDIAQDPHGAFEMLKTEFLAVCRLWKEGRSDQGSRTVETVRRIVRERYNQNMLSVNLIADELGITQPYLSSFFKKATGRTIVELIAETRLHEAKRFLAETDYTVAQIAQEVGYSNDIGFIRFFKKHEGITPGQYRENIQTECKP